MTQAGIILGTAAYMAPEQAKGKPVDRRADIWAFGCVLYEMLTGRRAFDGEDVTDTIAAVVTKEPDWSRLPASTPPSVERLLRRCLEKEIARASAAHRRRAAGTWRHPAERTRGSDDAASADARGLPGRKCAGRSRGDRSGGMARLARNTRRRLTGTDAARCAVPGSRERLEWRVVVA